jgi:hypothetical protein
MPRKPPKSTVVFDNISLSSDEDNLPAPKSSRYYIEMPEDDYLKLGGKEKSKATILRAGEKRRLRDKVPNPVGTNQYSKINAVKKFLAEADDKVKSTAPGVIETIVEIVMNTNETTLNRLRGCDILLSYTLAKPQYKTERAKEDKQTFIILPPDVILDETNIIKVSRVKDPEKNENEGENK